MLWAHLDYWKGSNLKVLIFFPRDNNILQHWFFYPAIKICYVAHLPDEALLMKHFNTDTCTFLSDNTVLQKMKILNASEVKNISTSEPKADIML